jgi:hypothetical protein
MTFIEGIKQKHIIYAFLLWISSSVFGVVANNIYHKCYDIDKTTHFEIVVSTLRDSSIVKARLDSLSNLKLESAIASVEKKNDGRFEVLTWSAVLILTLLAALAAFNFIASSLQVKEEVDIALEKRFVKMQEDFNSQLKTAENEVQTILDLSIAAQSAFNEINDLLIKVKSNTNSGK